MSSVVPEGWGKIDLEEGVSVLVSGQSPNRKENCATGDAFGILKTTAIHWGKFDEKQNQEVLDDYEPNMKHLVLENDILITKAGPAHRVGVVAQARNLRSNVLLSGKMTALRVNDKFSSDFLTYALCQEEAQNHLKANTTGMASSQTNFTHDALLRVPILSPPLPEQKKIASILTSVDEVIENTQKQIDKLQDLKKATMNELLTKGIGHTEFKDSELGQIPKSWEVVYLKKLVFVDVDSLKANTDSNYSFKYIDISCVSTGKVSLPANEIAFKDAPSRARKIIKCNDVLIATVRPNLKAFAHFDEEGENWVASTGFAILRHKENCDSKFIYNFMLSDIVTRQIDALIVGSNYPAINSKDVKELTILAPPLSEQQKIASILSSIDKRISQKSSKLHQTQSLKKSLMQDLLTGKVRVTVN